MEFNDRRAARWAATPEVEVGTSYAEVRKHLVEYHNLTKRKTTSGSDLAGHDHGERPGGAPGKQHRHSSTVSASSD